MGALTISSASATNTSSVLWMIAAVVLLAVVAIVALVLFNRKLAQRTASGPDSAFTLEQLRQMHEADQISENEYKTLKEKVIQENKS